jgi:ADP-ribose pyrophosphatase YjhB (NUDIX family)
VIEHHLQTDIIFRLSKAKSLRFSQLKPENMESNQFMYHLKTLIKQGYVEKLPEKGYGLSAKGLTYADGLTLENNKPRKQPKLIVIFGLRNKHGEWLLAERLLQPYIGQLMLPSGKQHFGESPEEHIRRELQEQLGSVPEVHRCGFTDVRIMQDGELITHVTGHVYTGSYDGKLPTASTKFKYHFIAPESADMVPRTKELIEAIESSEQPFFRSFEYENR